MTTNNEKIRDEGLEGRRRMMLEPMDRTADEPFRKKALLGSLRADNNSHKPESRNSKTISILMAGSSVNPFIGVDQICISA